MGDELSTSERECTGTLRIHPVETNHHPHSAKRQVKHWKSEIAGSEEQILSIIKMYLPIKSDMPLWSNQRRGVVDAIRLLRKAVHDVTRFAPCYPCDGVVCCSIDRLRKLLDFIDADEVVPGVEELRPYIEISVRVLDERQRGFDVGFDLT